MGVPNFYTWLKRRYPLAVYNFNIQHGHQTDFLYMDMNQVIYKCALQQNHLFKDQISQRRFDEVWVSIFNYIDRIVSLIKPTTVLFLTFDGVAPRAKMNQQRQRRFQSAKKAARIDEILRSIGEIERNQTFKNNQISPGTEFMHQLNAQIKFFIERKIHEDPRWRDLRVIFSGSDVPGEGEHKILEFIRNIQLEPSFDQGWRHMIYGADADLIMLGLLTQLKFISIVREIMKSSNEIQSATMRSAQNVEYELINLSIVREYIDLEYRALQPQMKIAYDVNRVIDDFIMICFFVGNDFLPRVFCFDIRLGTLEDLINLFKQHVIEASDYLNDRGRINWKEFTRLMKRLSRFERVAMENRESEIIEFFNSLESEQYDDAQLKVHQELSLLQKLKHYYQTDDQDGEIDARTYFYSSKCEFDLDSEDDIQRLQDLVFSYIEGIQFVLLYYFQGVPSWEWYYPAYYAPLCSDLFLYLSHIFDTKISNDPWQSIFPFSPDRPFPAFKQLLCILSPTNALLLPEQYRYLLTNLNSPLRTPIDYYPDEFEIDAYGTIWEHQFIAKIPFVPQELIDEVFLSVLPETLGNAIERNLVGTSHLFHHSQTPRAIKSQLPEIYRDSQSHQNVMLFDIDHKDSCMQLVKQLPRQQSDAQVQTLFSNQFQLPSLSLISTQTRLQPILDRGRKSNKLIIAPQTDIKPILKKMMEASRTKSRWFAYCGYPAPMYGEIMAMITIDSLTLAFDYKVSEIDLLDKVEYTPKAHVQVFNQFKDGTFPLDISQALKAWSRENAIDSDLQHIFIVKYYKEIFQRADGSRYFNRRTGIEKLVLHHWIFDTQPVDLVDIDRYIEHGSAINLNAVLLRSTEKGQVGSTVQVKKQNSNELTVSIIKEVPRFSNLHKPSSSSVTIERDQSKQVTYSIGFVADECMTHSNVLLTVLGRVPVFLDPSFDSFKDLVPCIDIGLNVIDRVNNKLVPELVRIHQADSTAQGVDKYSQFRKLELTKQCVEIINNYRTRCYNLFWFLERIMTRDKDLKNIPKILVTDVFPRAKDPNLSLMELYVWMSKQPFSNLTLSSSASSVIQSKKIATLQTVPQPPQPSNSNSEFSIDIRHVALSSAFYIPPFFTEHPPIHQLNDRVVCINDADVQHNFVKHKFGMPPLGSEGTVVGILDENDEIVVEVYWDQPYIGLTNLGSRCPLLRGSVCRFASVFNLTQNWSKLCAPSVANQEKGWNYRTRLFYPKFDSQLVQKRDEKRKKNGQTWKQIQEQNKVLAKEKEIYMREQKEQVQEVKRAVLTRKPEVKNGDERQQVTISNGNLNQLSCSEIEKTLNSMISGFTNDQQQSSIGQFDLEPFSLHSIENLITSSQPKVLTRPKYVEEEPSSNGESQSDLAATVIVESVGNPIGMIAQLVEQSFQVQPPVVHQTAKSLVEVEQMIEQPKVPVPKKVLQRPKQEQKLE